MKRIPYIPLVTILLMTSCAYFNTFYNARYYFNKGLEESKNNESGQVSSGERTNYQKSIEKSERLINLYPNSKYVDDALLIMGKSFYQLGDMYKARDRLESLRQNYPESGLVYEANLWIARVDMAQERYNEAETSLKNLKFSNISKTLKTQVHSSLGGMYLNTGRFADAVNEYSAALKTGGGEEKASFNFLIAACYDSLGQYDKAKEYSEHALEGAASRKVRFNARFAIGTYEKKLGNYDVAIRIFERLLLDELNKQWFPGIMLEIADCLKLKKDFDGAIVTLEDITQTYTRKKESAEAFYRLGIIFEEEKRDYDKAVHNYGSVRKAFSSSEFSDSANVRKRDILRMQALQQVIRMAVTGEEGEGISIQQEAADPDSAYSSTGQDSLRTATEHNQEQRQQESNENETDPSGRSRSLENQRPAIGGDPELRRTPGLNDQQKSGPVENPELSSFKTEELDKNLYLLGELFFTRFNLPDSAINRYSALIEQFPESPYAPRALYVLAHMYESVMGDTAASDSLKLRLVKEYSNSDLANDARESLGLEYVPTHLDSARNIFLSAEKELFENNNPRQAFSSYGQIYTRFPETSYAPKSMYLQGWIYETVWDSLSRAAAVYDSLCSRYPGSPYAGEVKAKLALYKKEINKSSQDMGEPADSAAAPADSLETPKETVVAETVLEKKSHADSAAVKEDPMAIKEQMLRRKRGIERSGVPKEEKAQTRQEPAETAKEQESDNEPRDIAKNARPDNPASVAGGIEALKKNINIPEMLKKSVPDIIVLQIEISEKGIPGNVEIAGKQEDSTLLAIMQAAVRKTKFNAARKDGQPVSSWMTLRVPLNSPDAE